MNCELVRYLESLRHGRLYFQSSAKLAAGAGVTPDGFWRPAIFVGHHVWPARLGSHGRLTNKIHEMRATSMNANREGARVSTFSRVLAWIFLACVTFALIGLAVAAARHQPLSMSREEIAGFVIGSLFICPLFLFVAVKGRSPRWITSMENLQGELAQRRGISASKARSSRRSMAVAASVAFGVGLAAFGNQMGVFSGETGWFAMVVFGLVWVIVAGIFWRMYGSRRRDRSDDTEEAQK